MNTGVKKLLYINFQMCLYDENKKLIVNDKYSMMKYIKDQYNVKKEDLENKMTLKAIFNFWKSKQKYSEFKKKEVNNYVQRVFMELLRCAFTSICQL